MTSLIRLYVVILEITGFALYLYTINLAYNLSGLFAAFLSAVLPVGANVYWIYDRWSVTGDFFNFYTQLNLFWIAFCVCGGVFIWLKTNKNSKNNFITEDNFQSLDELFLDAINLYSCSISKETLKASQSAKLTAIIIGKTVSTKQKVKLTEGLEEVIKMAQKAGLKKIIIDKHNEILLIINQKTWTIKDAEEDEKVLKEIDKEMLEAIYNYDGNYLKKRFPKHYF